MSLSIHVHKDTFVPFGITKNEKYCKQIAKLYRLYKKVKDIGSVKQMRTDVANKVRHCPQRHISLQKPEKPACLRRLN